MAQVVGLHPSCGLDNQPDWVIFNEFVLTTRPYIRTVSEVQVGWYVVVFVHRKKSELTERFACSLIGSVNMRPLTLI